MQASDSADIVVIGGGSAGICAAIAAARRGARVILLERSGQLGGMGTLAKVHTFCGLYHPDTTRPPEIANHGLPAEIEALMRSATGAEPVKMGRVYVLPQDPSIFSQIALNLTASEPSLQVRHHATCDRIIRKENGFQILTGNQAISCRALIDCSADAVAANLLGATRFSTSADHLQRSAFIFSLHQVAPAALEERFRMRLALDIVRAVEAGELSSLALGTASRGSVLPGEVYFTTDLDPEPSGDLMMKGRRLASQLTHFLKRHYPEYVNASEPILAAEPGVRETYRWKGLYTLTEDDLVEGVDFPDTVAYATWPIELRENTRGPKLRFFKRPVPANIPLRSLVSAEISGVFFAGRCLSATHEALASLRVMGTCFATGQAAGIAAVDSIK